MTARQGFTLVEVIVATVLLGVAALSLAAYTGASVQHLFLANQLSVATVVAREQADSIRARPFDSVQVGRFTATRTIGRFTFFIANTVELSSPRLKTVRINITDARGRTVEEFGAAVYSPRSIR